MNCEKLFAKLQKMKNTQSTIKPIKIRKQPGTTYWFGCLDVKTIRRILGQKKSKWQISTQSKISLCCLSIKLVKIFETKNKLTTNVIKLRWRYCVKCRKDTENIDSKMVRTKDNRLIMQAKCLSCGIKKSRLLKEQEAKGLLSNLGIKTLLSKIPLLNILLNIKMN